MDLTLLDHINLNSRLSANFACGYSEDDKIFILSEAGVFVMSLKGSPESILPKISFRKDIVKLTNTSLCESLDINLNNFINELPRNAAYEAILDISISGNMLNTAELEAKPIYAMWSPRGIVEKTGCVLAVLNNLHDIEFYAKTIDENEIIDYICIANFSKYISDHYRRSWKRIEGFSDEAKLYELKKRVNFTTPTTFTWSHVVLKDRKAGCILFVGHRDGAITAWRLVERKGNENLESKLEFLERYETKIKHITALHWFCQKSDAGGLSVGDSEGRVCALLVSKLSTDKIKFSEEVVFNEECDLKVDKITVINYQNITYMIVVKLNHLLIYAINDDGEVFQGKLVQAGNLYITGIMHYEKNILLVLSFCGQLTHVELDVVNNELVITEKQITLNIDSNKYRTHGLLFSHNKVFLGVLSYPCQLKDVSRGRGFVNFFLFKNTLKNPFEILMDSNATSLRDYWDCFETLRVSSIKEKKFPWIGIDPNLNYDSLSLLKLKTLRLIAKMSEKIYSLIPRIEEYNIKSYYLLNYMVDIKLAVQRITKLLNIFFSERKLSLFQMQSMDLLNFYLKEVVAMDILTKANLGETFIDEIYDVMRMANELNYPPPPQCVWCGEKLIGSSCVPFHVDSRCAMSLMPIRLSPGYKCPFCKCVVSREMDREYYPIFCPYCDVPMERRYADKKFRKEYSEQSKPITHDTIITQLDDVVTSDCFSDCLKSDVNLDDVEENDTEYIIFTDSEDEDTSERVKELYSRIKRICLENTPQGIQINTGIQVNTGVQLLNDDDDQEIVGVDVENVEETINFEEETPIEDLEGGEEW